ncbi:MAG: hypothetical protein GY801_03265, partial [bacterium]|nr:hypothetical protein [bacterium]
LEWQTSAHEESLLVHRGSRLDDAQALLQHPGFPLNDLERLYVEACVDLRTKEQEKEEQQRQRELTLERRAKRRLQWLAAFLGTLVSIEHKRAC